MVTKTKTSRIRIARSLEQEVPRSATDTVDESTDTHAIPSADRDGQSTYIQEIRKTPLLSTNEEESLANRIRKGDNAARNQMVSANLRLVVKIAHDYNNFGLPLSDLISEGNIGLIKAVERFDPSKGGKLSTYAAWWIKQSIKRALANQSKTIRLPVHLVDRIASIRRATAKLTDELDREPTDEEIAYATNLPVNKIAHLKSVSVRPSSLDAPVGEDGETSFGEIVGDETQATPLENLQEKSANGYLHTVLQTLEPREAEILRLRFGLDGEHPLTLEEVGEKFNVTRERIRQIQNLAIHKMRRMLTDNERQRSAEEVQQERVEQGRREVLKEFFEENTTSRE